MTPDYSKTHYVIAYRVKKHPWSAGDLVLVHKMFDSAEEAMNHYLTMHLPHTPTILKVTEADGMTEVVSDEK